MKITNKMVEKAYEVSKSVFEGKLKQTAGKNVLVQIGMNINSAADYIHIFKHMLDGKRFTRTINAFSAIYFLTNIKKDFGSKGLSNALVALKCHISYYQSLEKGNLLSLSKVYNEFFPMIISEIIDSQEQDELVLVLKKERISQKDIIRELKNVQPSDPKEIPIKGKTYSRDNYIIALLKILRNFSCQICSTKILKADGSFYIEAAHIHPKRLAGCETPDNILILCPNHHKEFDYGDRIINKQTQSSIAFTLNEVQYKISLKIK